MNLLEQITARRQKIAAAKYRESKGLEHFELALFEPYEGISVAYPIA